MQLNFQKKVKLWNKKLQRLWSYNRQTSHYHTNPTSIKVHEEISNTLQLSNQSMSTLKLSMRENLPEPLTWLFAQLKISASVISFPCEWNLKFFNNCRMLYLINCHRNAGNRKWQNEMDKTWYIIFNLTYWTLYIKIQKLPKLLKHKLHLNKIFLLGSSLCSSLYTKLRTSGQRLPAWFNPHWKSSIGKLGLTLKVFLQELGLILFFLSKILELCKYPNPTRIISQFGYMWDTFISVSAI